MNKNKMMNKQKIPCEVCGGSGQISYFKGVSRFLLSWEDCPECNGMGFKIAPDEAVESETKTTEREGLTNGKEE